MGKRLEKKMYRLQQLEQLLLEHPAGLTKAEIAGRLQISRSLAPVYLADLGQRLPVYEPEPGRYSLDRATYQTTVQFTLHEAMSIHLAGRLLATRTDKHNPHAATALRKLGRALDRMAPLVSRHLSLSADVLDDDSRRRDPVFMRIIETLTRAWADGRKVRLTHQKETGQTSSYVFSPYFLEPYAIGRTMHVIGWREPPGALRTLKVERLRAAELLSESYTIPADFDPRAQLKDAWGIWTSDQPPAEVELRFSARVASRVRETQWHASEQVANNPDGSLTWRAYVAEWREMVHWVRGWGADCEVLAPAEMRVEAGQEAERLRQLYAG